MTTVSVMHKIVGQHSSTILYSMVPFLYAERVHQNPQKKLLPISLVSID
jgi:hypothetical protein